MSDPERTLVAMAPGSVIEWGGGNLPPTNGTGVLIMVTDYDGIMAHVQMGHKRVMLHAYSRGFWVRPGDPAKAEGPGLNGDGI